MSRTEAITCLPQIVTLRGCEERMRDQRGTKVAPSVSSLMLINIQICNTWPIKCVRFPEATTFIF